jgi:hypothetical protein
MIHSTGCTTIPRVAAMMTMTIATRMSRSTPGVYPVGGSSTCPSRRHRNAGISAFHRTDFGYRIHMNPIERTVRRVDEFQQSHTPVAFLFAVTKKFGDDNAGVLVSNLAY